MFVLGIGIVCYGPKAVRNLGFTGIPDRDEGATVPRPPSLSISLSASRAGPEGSTLDPGDIGGWVECSGVGNGDNWKA